MHLATRTHRSNRIILASLIALLSTGCGAMTRKLTREATPAAVDSGIEAATSEANQDAIVDSIDPHRVEKATEKVVAGTSDGLAEAIDPVRVQDLTDKMVGGSTDGFLEALSKADRQQRLGDALGSLAASIVDSAMDQALDEEHLGRVRALSKQATLGFQDAIDEVDAKKKSGEISEDEGNVLDAADEVAESGNVALYVLGAIAAALFLLLVTGVVWALRRKKQYDRDNEKRDRALQDITMILSGEGIGKNDGEGASPYDPERLRESVKRWAEQRHQATEAKGH